MDLELLKSILGFSSPTSSSAAIIAVSGSVLICSLIFALFSTRPLPFLVGLIALLCASVSVWASHLYDSSPARYVGTVFSCLFFLTVQSEVMGKCFIRGKDNIVPIGLFGKRLKYELTNNMFYGSMSYLSNRNIDSPFVTVSEAVYTLWITFVGDGAIYFLFEVMPYNQLREGDISTLHCILVSIWVYCALELAYIAHMLFARINGCALSNKIMHNHPLLSTSLAEFWGVRWNPVVAKLLQKAVYYPLNNLGLTRSLCVLCVLIASAILHGLPHYFHSYDLVGALRVASFFVVQAPLLLIQRAVFEAFSVDTSKSNSYVKMPLYFDDSSGKFFDAMAFIFLYCYCFSIIWQSRREIVFPFDGNIFAAIPIAAISALAAAMRYDVIRLRDRLQSAFSLLTILTKWAITMILIAITIPLLVVPSIPVLQSCYNSSFLTGPLIRLCLTFFEKRK